MYDDECINSSLYESSLCDSYWTDQKPPLLVISLTGFRSDYLDRKLLNGNSAAPTLNRLARSGIWASSGMMPSYPTMTLPNHYSIVTGLYPESHGIVDKSFYDPDYAWASFSPTSPQQTQSFWWNGEPIWTTAKKQVTITFESIMTVYYFYFI